MEKSKNILVLAPHTDDAELGCGGTIAKYIEERKNVFIAAFSLCKDSIPEGYELNILEKEFKHAAEVLCIPKENIFIFDYPVRRFNEFRQSILDDLLKLRNLINPEYVFAPSPHDIHQDHNVIAVESMRAFKNTSLFGYEVPWNNFEFRNQAYVSLTSKHVEKKIQAIGCYETQKKRAYAQPDFTRGQAKMHGTQIGVEYAEVFEVLRLIY